MTELEKDMLISEAVHDIILITRLNTDDDATFGYMISLIDVGGRYDKPIKRKFETRQAALNEVLEEALKLI